MTDRFIAEMSPEGWHWTIVDSLSMRMLFGDQLPTTEREAKMCARSANRAAAAVLEHIEAQVGQMVKDLRGADLMLPGPAPVADARQQDSDRIYLVWLHARLQQVYKEHPDADFMLRLKRMIGKITP